MYVVANYLLFLCLIGLLAGHVYLASKSKSVFTCYLIIAYSAGMAFYLILPSGIKIFFGEHFMDIHFLSGLGVEDVVLTQVMTGIFVCISMSLFTFIIVNGLGIKREENRNLLPRFTGYISFRLNRFLFLAAWVISLVLVFQASRSGLIVTGERGQGLSVPLLVFINTLLPILLAFFLDGVRTKQAVVLAVLAVTLILFLNTFFVDGSRRGVAFFFIFIVLPLLVHIRVLSKAGAIVLMALAACAVILYGMLRKGLSEIESFHDVASLVSFVNFNVFIEKLLVNADFSMVFDALVGVFKRVPEEVSYLYGDTLLKFFYFPIPRSVWPDKPESISVVVAKRIYEVGDSPVSFNPTIIGELYFNLGWIGLFWGGIALGLLLALIAILIRKLESGHRLSYLVAAGFVSMTMFNLWRGYTFEVIFGLAVFLIIFFGVEFVLRRSTWRRQCFLR